jgi:exosortase/archaeosortase family protein
VKSHSSLFISQEKAVLAVKIGVLFLATIAFFWQDLYAVFNDVVQNEAASYVLVIPPMVFYLVFRKRKMIKASLSTGAEKIFGPITFGEVFGLILFLFSILLYWQGSSDFNPLFRHLVVLPFFVASCILLLFNKKVLKELAFSITILFLLVPLPSAVATGLGAFFSNLSSELSFALLKSFMPINLTYEYGSPTILMLKEGGTVTFNVGVACSGLYSLIGFAVFVIFVTYLVRGKLWKKAAVFAIGFPLIYSLNIIRIVLILMIGYYIEVNFALTLFHLLGGWILIFLGTLFLIFLSEKLLKLDFVAKRQDKCAECTSKAEKRILCFNCGRLIKARLGRLQKRDLVKISGLILIVVLVQIVQAPVFALSQNPGVTGIDLQTRSGNFTDAVLPKIDGYDGPVYGGRDYQFEALAHQDVSVWYEYFTQDSAKDKITVTVEIASSEFNIHNWEVCLIEWPASTNGSPNIEDNYTIRDFVLDKDANIIGRDIVFQWKNITRESIPVKISVYALRDDYQDMSNVEKQLLEVAGGIVSHWKPISNWSEFVSLASLYGGQMISYVIVPFGIVCLLFYLFEKKKMRAQSIIEYDKLSKTDRQLINVIRQTQSTMKPTFTNILQTYRSIVKEPITAETLFMRLSKLETTSVVSRYIINSQDEPILAWKVELR